MKIQATVRIGKELIDKNNKNSSGLEFSSSG
jgi:hypothetical protein